ncbi:hypothetical protein WJX73_005753 [Symbiochloris irregularis]|uniref:Glutathione peroxidase n=1 Tax=Symbiochloris irregularis TaxID=706552 RepID=A0AAW1NLR8_9CHLO
MLKSTKPLASALSQQCLSNVSRSPASTLHLAASSSCLRAVSQPHFGSRHPFPSQQGFGTWSAAPSRSQKRQARRMATNVMSPSKQADSFYDFTVKDIDGNDINLKEYKGKVVLCVNVASQCGFTPQYKELAQLYERHKDKGFVILGFPCNQFGAQEPGDNEKVKKFARERGAKFPMMSKVDVNGAKADPVYTFMKKKQGGMLFADIKWNFTKFLLDRDGNVIKRWGSVTTPLSIEDDIKALL